MGYARILQASDIHESDSYNLPKYKHIRDLANRERVDAVVLAGDFFGAQELKPILQVHNEGVARLMDWIPRKDRYVMELGLEVKLSGGIDHIKADINSPETDTDSKKELETLAKRYDKNKTAIEAAQSKYARHVAFNKKWMDDEIQEVRKELDKDVFYRCKRLDKVLEGINCPVYAVRGNWETDRFAKYNWKKMKFLEKGDVVNLKGIRIAGAPNWYEQLARMPDEDYKDMEEDIAWGGNTYASSKAFDIFIEKHGSPQDKQIWNEHRLAPEAFLRENAPFNRLVGQEIDLLVTHKGPHNLAVEGRKNYGSGVGLEAIVRLAQPKIITGGHIHGKGLAGKLKVDDEYSYQFVRTSDEVMTVLNIDTETKEIAQNGVQVFRWPDTVRYEPSNN